jgi:Domain of unknown function (DUF397)
MDGLNSVEWRKSSYSGGNGGNCVEVAVSTEAVMVRDTTDRHGLVLAVSADAWRQFTAAVRLPRRDKTRAGTGESYPCPLPLLRNVRVARSGPQSRCCDAMSAFRDRG